MVASFLGGFPEVLVSWQGVLRDFEEVVVWLLVLGGCQGTVTICYC